MELILTLGVVSPLLVTKYKPLSNSEIRPSGRTFLPIQLRAIIVLAVVSASAGRPGAEDRRRSE